MKALKFPLLLIISILLISCEKDKEDVLPVRIFPGEGTDNIKIGDTKSEVQGVLGVVAISSFSGSYTDYTTNTVITFTSYWATYDALGITVYLNGENQSVSSMSLYEPYTGKTRDKIGIGSSKESVEDIFGMTNQDGGYYEYQSLGIDFKYSTSNTVERIYLYKKN